MSNGKEYEVKGIINLFGLVFETERLSELYENAFRIVCNSKRIDFQNYTKRIDYDYISSLPFVFSETENGIVVFSVSPKRLSIAKPVSEIVESTNDAFDVVEIDEETFNDALDALENKEKRRALVKAALKNLPPFDERGN